MNRQTISIVALLLAGIAVAVFLRWKSEDDSTPSNAGRETTRTQAADWGSGRAPAARPAAIDASTSEAEQRKREESNRAEVAKLAMFSTQNALSGLDLAKQRLVEDLDLSAGETAELEKIFARRAAELSGLLASMYSGEGSNDMELMRKICALLRNKGLREELGSVLSPEKLATFDANEATRERETNEARAYRDMAEINEVVTLTDPQKEQVLAALIKHAPAKVEQEADARAFMTLHYGQMLTDVDSSAIRGISNMVSAGLNDEMPLPDFGTARYQRWTQDNKTERIESELSALRNILDEKQLSRYREHLEAEPPW